MPSLFLSLQLSLPRYSLIMSVCVCRLEPEYYFPVFVPETAASIPYIPKVKYIL